MQSLVKLHFIEVEDLLPGLQIRAIKLSLDNMCQVHTYTHTCFVMKIHFNIIVDS
jgi:Trehalose-6-phosphatase